MKNKDKWRQYTDGLPSPDNFIDWSYRFLVSSALQRRVWMPPEHDKVYPNQYICLVGDPGVGKGGPIRAVSSILNEHKLEDSLKDSTLTGDQLTVAKALLEKDVSNAHDDMVKGPDKAATDVERPALIPVAADAVTYQALVQSMAHCYRYINYIGKDDEGKAKQKIYGHSSQCFCLEEKASLFQKHTNDLINFLIQAWDCGESYEYRTKNKGRDRILRICVNMISGTTPDFMQSTFDDALVNQGYSARTIFVYGAKNRKSVFFRPELTAEQKAYRAEISQHIKSLTRLYGQVRIDPTTIAWLQKWKESDDKAQQQGLGAKGKLVPYRARKNLHLMKTACANHFGESAEMYISQAEFEEALEDLTQEEKTMAIALMVGGENKLNRVANKVHEFLNVAGKRTFNELWAQFFEKATKDELTDVLEFLQATGKVKASTEADEQTGIGHIYYSAKETGQ